MNTGKILPVEAAEILNTSPQFVRVAMQQGKLPIGIAIKMSTKWTYNISGKLLTEYSGKDVEKIRVKSGGQSALTSYHVVAVNAQGTVALVAFYPHTGRTHQIRVHASYVGMPLVGDIKYGGVSDFFKQSKTHARVMLHAAVLSFSHPEDGRPMMLTAPLPDDMQRVMHAAQFPEKLDIEKWIKDHPHDK